MIPKFRAWVKTGKRMVETDDLLGINYEDKEIITQKIYFESGLPVERDIDNYDFDEIVLMQSTGLKDKNGKEIFEKDIVDFKGRKAIVKWHGSYASFIYEFVDELQNRKTEWQPLYLSYYHFEIIGNIYENPELLEVTE
nr:MAG TPA: YopX protein [Caudoviricetes sp.]